MRTFIALLLFVCWAQASFADSFIKGVRQQNIIKHGKEAYNRRCSGCHGDKGDGKGPGAAFLDPRPRDFTQGIFKFKTTPIDALPSDSDLMRTITRGLNGTSMPGFALVPEVERFAIIQYLKTFAKERWGDPSNRMASYSGADFPRNDFTDSQKFLARAKAGRELYIEACLVCHGVEGHGDGEGSVDLQDDWGNPIVPANLTKKYIKTGYGVKDIYRSIISGIGGTPMPAFKDSYTDEQIWDIAAFVLYLRGLHNGHYGQKRPLKVIPPES